MNTGLRLTVRSIAVVLLTALAVAAGQPGTAPGRAARAIAAPAGPVAAYSFDAGSGATLTDESGHGHHGTISGATWTSSGRYGGALSFDGVDDVVTIADSALLDLTTGMTLEAWISPTDQGGSWRTIALKERDNGLIYALYTDPNNGLPAGYIFLDGAEHNATGPLTVPTETWTHLAATFDGSVLRLYVDGALTETTSVSGSIQTSSGTLGIGGNSVWSEYFAGRIDELRIYDRALSQAEVQANMTTSVGGGAPAPTQTPAPSLQGPVAAYSFNAGSGSTLADESGYAHHGTISGATWTSDGKFGSALSFDGNNDSVTIADASRLDLTTGMTLEAWVYPTALGSNWRTIVLKERSNGLAYALYAGPPNGLPSGYIFLASGEQNATGAAPYPLNAWTHVAATFDGSTIRLYVDGALTETTSASGSIQTSSGALRIGGNSVWGEHFKGRIDEVRVYNRPLSQAEIQADMVAVVSAPTATSTPTSTSTTTPTATSTPAATDTPAPTATATPSPTDTPAPTATDTPTPTATSTPAPTDTPMPTATSTPAPSDTPTPTATATPSPTDIPTPTATGTPSPTTTPAPTSTPSPTTAPPATATSTLVPTQTPTAAPSYCAPRPNVQMSVAPSGPGRLAVTIVAGTSVATPSNQLRAIRFGTATNALIHVHGVPSDQTSSVNVTLPAGTRSVSFVVSRVSEGAATSVPLVVVDDCGEWRTFVGGGPNAF